MIDYFEKSVVVVDYSADCLDFDLHFYYLNFALAVALFDSVPDFVV